MFRTAATLLLLAWAATAQNAPVRPTFEVASVKPVEPGRPGPHPLRGGPGTKWPGQISGAATMKALLMRAYDMKNYQVNGPGWMDSERYEIAAKIPEGATKAQVALMLQGLIAERFHVAAHRETRDLPIYALLVAKNGPKLKASAPEQNGDAAESEDALAQHFAPKLVKGADGLPEMAPGSTVPRSYEIILGGSDGLLYKLWARRETVQQLAERLSSQLNRAVVDMTGLKAQYDFTLVWAVETAGGVVPRTYPPPDQIESHTTPLNLDPGLSIFAAVQSQLGLKLEARKARLEILVVDRADKTPTVN